VTDDKGVLRSERKLWGAFFSGFRIYMRTREGKGLWRR